MRAERRSEILIKICEFKGTECLVYSAVSHQCKPRAPRISWRTVGYPASTVPRPGFCNSKIPSCRKLPLPLLNFCITEGGETGKAVLLVVVNHVFRDLFDGRKGPWEVNKGEGELAGSVPPLTKMPIS